jgi:hypothetical protein
MAATTGVNPAELLRGGLSALWAKFGENSAPMIRQWANLPLDAIFVCMADDNGWVYGTKEVFEHHVRGMSELMKKYVKLLARNLHQSVQIDGIWKLLLWKCWCKIFLNTTSLQQAHKKDGMTYTQRPCLLLASVCRGETGPATLKLLVCLFFMSLIVMEGTWCFNPHTVGVDCALGFYAGWATYTKGYEYVRQCYSNRTAMCCCYYDILTL